MRLLAGELKRFRDLLSTFRRRVRRWRRASGRLADVHMWTLRDGWTCRVQAFRDGAGRTIAVVTLRPGDRGPGHINGAEMFRADVAAQFFPDEQHPPILVANVLDPGLRFADSPQVVTLDFDEAGIFDYHHATDPTDIQTLTQLGAEWDDGSGYQPYVPPPPLYVCVWRRFPVRELPPRNLFRDMTPYLQVNWEHAVQAAITAIHADGPIGDDVAPDVAAAATTLLHEAIELARGRDKIRYVNGQHRTEAMRRQGVAETVLRETRLIADPPLAGEIRPIEFF